MTVDAVQIRQVTEPTDRAIRAFGELQNRVYADSDLLIPAEYLPVMLSRQAGERRNLMLVAEFAGEVVGGVVFHCFPRIGTGFSSFLAVAPEWRGMGLARRLHMARFEALDQAAGVPVRRARGARRSPAWTCSSAPASLMRTG